MCFILKFKKKIINFDLKAKKKISIFVVFITMTLRPKNERFNNILNTQLILQIPLLNKIHLFYI